MGEDDNSKYEQELYKALNYSNDHFDKNILFIASGALGISFAFIEKLVRELNKANCKSYLISAWYCFSFVVFISLVAHFVSMLSIQWSIKNHTSPNFEKGRRRWNKVIRFLNISMMVGLLIGILLLFSFVKQNI